MITDHATGLCAPLVLSLYISVSLCALCTVSLSLKHTISLFSLFLDLLLSCSLFSSLDGETSLHASAHWGHGRGVEILLAAGANPNAVMKDGRSPLYLASQHGHPSCVRPLLDAGADIDAAAADGWEQAHINYSAASSYQRTL